jgi:hypothetical protein
MSGPEGAASLPRLFDKSLEGERLGDPQTEGDEVAQLAQFDPRRRRADLGRRPWRFGALSCLRKLTYELPLVMPAATQI